MDKIDYCFLILHYKDATMTEQTVSSILSLDKLQAYKIVIVDNASPDGSGARLRKKYQSNKNICLIKTDENQGFSKGNNLGYQYIKENFVPEFLICANNDVLFVQKDFLSRLKQLYIDMPFYVCGPDIYIPWRDFHANPLSSKSDKCTLKNVNTELEQIDQNLLSYKKRFSFRIFKLYIAQKARKNVLMQKIYQVLRSLQKRSSHKEVQENVILRGACLIFDQRFISEAHKLFEPETFLYGEEYILSFRCRKQHWKTVYFPEIVVDHIHEGNSKLNEMSYKKFCNYLEEKAEYQKEALIILKKYIEKGNG